MLPDLSVEFDLPRTAGTRLIVGATVAAGEQQLQPNAVVNLSSPKAVLTYIPGTLEWRRNTAPPGQPADYHNAVRDAYDAAMARTRTKKHLLVAGMGGAFVPERVEWLHAEMLKTRVAHGYCSRHPAGACPYANICEQCDNFATAPEFATALSDQLADVRVLRDDAAARGWDAEVARHDRVITSIEGHTRRLRASRP